MDYFADFSEFSDKTGGKIGEISLAFSRSGFYENSDSTNQRANRGGGHLGFIVLSLRSREARGLRVRECSRAVQQFVLCVSIARSGQAAAAAAKAKLLLTWT